MKIRVCDICEQEKEIFFRCRVKRHTFEILDVGLVLPSTTWFRAEICEDCLKKIAEEASKPCTNHR